MSVSEASASRSVNFPEELSNILKQSPLDGTRQNTLTSYLTDNPQALRTCIAWLNANRELVNTYQNSSVDFLARSINQVSPKTVTNTISDVHNIAKVVFHPNCACRRENPVDTVRDLLRLYTLGLCKSDDFFLYFAGSILAPREESQLDTFAAALPSLTSDEIKQIATMLVGEGFSILGYSEFYQPLAPHLNKLSMEDLPGIIFDEEGKLVPPLSWIVPCEKLTISFLKGLVKREGGPALAKRILFSPEGENKNSFATFLHEYGDKDKTGKYDEETFKEIQEVLSGAQLTEEDLQQHPFLAALPIFPSLNPKETTIVSFLSSRVKIGGCGHEPSLIHLVKDFTKIEGLLKILSQDSLQKLLLLPCDGDPSLFPFINSHAATALPWLMKMDPDVLFAMFKSEFSSSNIDGNAYSLGHVLCNYHVLTKLWPTLSTKLSQNQIRALYSTCRDQDTVNCLLHALRCDAAPQSHLKELYGVDFKSEPPLEGRSLTEQEMDEKLLAWLLEKDTDIETITKALDFLRQLERTEVIQDYLLALLSKRKEALMRQVYDLLKEEEILGIFLYEELEATDLSRLDLKAWILVQISAVSPGMISADQFEATMTAVIHRLSFENLLLLVPQLKLTVAFRVLMTQDAEGKTPLHRRDVLEGLSEFLLLNESEISPTLRRHMMMMRDKQGKTIFHNDFTYPPGAPLPFIHGFTEGYGFTDRGPFGAPLLMRTLSATDAEGNTPLHYSGVLNRVMPTIRLLDIDQRRELFSKVNGKGESVYALAYSNPLYAQSLWAELLGPDFQPPLSTMGGSLATP